MTFETRTVAAEFEMRDAGSDGLLLEGYAATFGEPYDMGPFDEQVNHRAFNRTLGTKPDVRLLVDHEGQPLARTKSGTLQLSTDTRGFHWRAPLEASDPDVQRLVPKIRRGDLGECSFAFRVPSGGDSWDYSGERAMRTLNEVSMQGGDVSIVTYPANPNTSLALRQRDEHEARCLFVEQVARELRAGANIPAATLAQLRHALDLIAAADDAVDKAQPILAAVLGVPNPDSDDPDSDGDSETPGGDSDADMGKMRGLTPEMARRLIAYRSVA